jgi:FAD/FMN-containing dehydrogenase
MISTDSASAISSPGSEDGRSPCAGPASKESMGSGLAPVPVSRFRAPAKDRATPTSATFGPLFTDSSPSAALQSSLESRLRLLLAESGSPEFALTWKTWDMLAGQPICALRASAHRTDGRGCTGWPTPNTLAAWPTPQAHDAVGPRTEEQLAAMRARGHGASNLHETVRLAGGQDAAQYSAAAGFPVAFRLNPRFSLWLMGYPAAWASCGERATQSCLRSRKPLSGRG